MKKLVVINVKPTLQSNKNPKVEKPRTRKWQERKPRILVHQNDDRNSNKKKHKPSKNESDTKLWFGSIYFYLVRSSFVVVRSSLICSRFEISCGHSHPSHHKSKVQLESSEGEGWGRERRLSQAHRRRRSGQTSGNGVEGSGWRWWERLKGRIILEYYDYQRILLVFHTKKTSGPPCSI